MYCTLERQHTVRVKSIKIYKYFFALQKNFQEVIEDCSKALELNSKYVKALFRRAKAFEMVQEKMKCLEGKMRQKC